MLSGGKVTEEDIPTQFGCVSDMSRERYVLHPDVGFKVQIILISHPSEPSVSDASRGLLTLRGPHLDQCRHGSGLGHNAHLRFTCIFHDTLQGYRLPSPKLGERDRHFISWWWTLPLYTLHLNLINNQGAIYFGYASILFLIISRIQMNTYTG